MNNSKAVRENAVFLAIENIEKEFTKVDVELIMKACKKRLKKFEKMNIVKWMRDVFDEDLENPLVAIRWRLYEPDEDRKKWLAYADFYCPHLSAPALAYEDDRNW